MRKHNNQSRVVFGAAIVFIGFLFLLDNLHIFSVRHALHFWPVAFILVGFMKLTQTQNTAGTVVGGALVTIGSLMTLNNLGWINFNLGDWWPVLIIVGGISIILKGQRMKTESSSPVYVDGNPSNTIDTVAIMSGNKSRIDYQDFRGGEATAIMGGIELDLRDASIQTEAVLNVFAVWAGIEIKVPADWTVICNGMPILGGVEDKTVPPLQKISA